MLEKETQFFRLEEISEKEKEKIELREEYKYILFLIFNTIFSFNDYCLMSEIFS